MYLLKIKIVKEFVLSGKQFTFYFCQKYRESKELGFDVKRLKIKKGNFISKTVIHYFNKFLNS